MIKKNGLLQITLGAALLHLLCFSLKAQRKAMGNLWVEAVGEIPAALTEKLEQYNNIRSAGFASWDASGKGIYITTRFAEVAQIHLVKEPGAYREQITFFKEPVTRIALCPHPGKNGFLYQRDEGGNEQFQIYYFNRLTGTSTLLTDGKSRNSNYLWNKKGDKIAFCSTRRNGRDLDFYITPLENTAASKLILENKGNGWGIIDWSEDETQMVVVNYLSINEAKLYLLNLSSGKLDEIRPGNTAIAYPNTVHSARFSKNGKGIFLCSDEDAEYKMLRYYDIASGKILKIEAILNDVEAFDLSDDGSKLVFVKNEGGYSKPYLMNTQTFTYVPLPVGLMGVIQNMKFNKDNNQLAFSFSAPQHPSELYVYNLKNGKTKRWTYSETAGLNPAQFSKTTLINYPTFDKDEQTGKRRMIPAFLISPQKISGKLPVLISIHGGPESQSRAGFNERNQFFANELGVAVLVPNVRGSSGYGKSYLKLDNGFLRENSVKDIGALLDWIATQPQLDTSRVAVIGGSYGGYMSLASMTRYNNRLTCGIDLFGISNFVSFLNNTAGYRVDLRRAEYGDEQDPKMKEHLIKISPLTNIKNITKPMFIYQGENDPRVPLSESEQMLEALKQNDVNVSYVIAKDEGHGLAKKANRDYVLAAMALFLKQHLLGK